MSKKVIPILLGSLFILFVAFPREKSQVQRLPEFNKQSVAAMNTGNSKISSYPDYGKIPLYFIPNNGQTDQQVKFYAKASRYTLWLTREGLVFDSMKRDKINGERFKEEGGGSIHQSSLKAGKVSRDVSSLLFIGANPNVEIIPVEATNHRVSYLMGNDRAKWHNDIKTSKAVLYKEIYANIDLKVYGIEKQIEYDWMVKPGGDPKSIQFKYQHVKHTRLDADGNLVIETQFGQVVHKKPVAYQRNVESYDDREGHRQMFDIAFKKIGENRWGFEVGEYNRSLELVIDPVVMLYSTYLGGSLSDWIRNIAVDSSGCAYVTGWTLSRDFPTKNPYQLFSGNSDAFVTKLNASGNDLVYSTYLGGGGQSDGRGIAVDDSGCAYVTGETDSSNFPTQNPIQTYQGNGDVFITKLNASGTGLVYSTYLGGSKADGSISIGVDSSGCAYVTGYTNSSDFPIKNAYQDHLNMDADGFISKLACVQMYMVSFTSEANGSLSGVLSQNILEGDSTTPVTATPNSGYYFVNWTGTGGFESTTNPLTVTNVRSDMTITAHFAKPVTVKFTAGYGGYLKIAGIGVRSRF